MPQTRHSTRRRLTRRLLVVPVLAAALAIGAVPVVDAAAANSSGTGRKVH